MKFDMHTHHSRCGHAEGEIEDYIQSAIEVGLDVIGISDHSPIFFSDEEQALPKVAMAKSEFPNYVEEVLALKEKYQDKIEVLLGVESDFFPDHTELYSSIYKKYPIDYVIGSVHFTGKKPLFHPSNHVFNRTRWDGLTEEEILVEKERYLDLIQQSAKSGLFHILGHMDALKAYHLSLSEIETPKLEETMKVIGESGVAIEVNTSAKLRNPGLWYPDNSILELAHHYGVAISFGSDSHTPDRIGDEFEEVRSHLKNIGFKQMVIYRNRERVSVDI